jgi:hypothetical protein
MNKEQGEYALEIAQISQSTQMILKKKVLKASFAHSWEDFLWIEHP